MSKYNFHLPNKPATKSGSILSYDYSDNRTFIPQPLTFSRGSNATYIDKDGLIKSTTGDLPRINRQDGSLLLEPSSTNLIGDSEDFSQSSWAKSNVQVQNGFSSPDGLNNAYKVTKTDSHSMLYFNYNPNRLTDSRSIWAKTTSGTGQVHLCAYHNNANSLFTITEDWQRFDLTGYISTGGNAFYAVDFRGSSTLSEVILWGAQAEDNSFTTSYIPTYGTTATRLAETCTNSGSEQDFNQTEGVLYVEAATLATGHGYKIITSHNGSGAYSRYLEIVFRLQTNQVSVKGVFDNDSPNFSFSLANELEFNKIALVFNGSTLKAFANGNLVGSRVSNGYFSDLSRVSLTKNNEYFYGKVRNLRVFKRALSDTELYLLTSEEYQSYQAMATALNYTI